MKSNYEERKARRIARYKELADKNAKLAEQHSEQASKMASVIPFGQPILIGHHSEKRDRNYRNKIHRMHEKSWESNEKSRYYEQKAEIAANNDAISSDDPKALEKLKEKLRSLQHLQQFMKTANKIIRSRKHTREEKLKALATYDVSQELIDQVVNNNLGFARFSLGNNNQNIGRVKERITLLEKISARSSEEVNINGVRIYLNVEANRVQLFFPGKPEETIQQLLKRNGFRWSPREGAWQRHISNVAIQYAKEIANQLAPEASNGDQQQKSDTH
jgi:hypothetical protein